MQNMSSDKSALGLDANITALIGYPIGLLALVLIFIEKNNKFVRFHALQSVIWSVGVTIFLVAIAIIGGGITFGVAMVSGTLGWLIGAVVTLLHLVGFVALFGGIIYGAIKAYGGHTTKLPVAGNLAEKWV
jgi:uncharacterized membrane protein